MSPFFLSRSNKTKPGLSKDWVNVLYHESSCSLLFKIRAFDSRAAHEYIVNVDGFSQQGLHCGKKVFFSFFFDTRLVIRTTRISLYPELIAQDFRGT